MSRDVEGPPGGACGKESSVERHYIFNSWTPAPYQFELREGEIHVWRARLDCKEDVLRQFETTLAPDERVRANRFFFSQDRDDFVATRGILRELLGKYVKRPPATLKFDYSSHGKPSLCAEINQGQLEFNVSHSHGMALLAFAAKRHVGVDIELIVEDFGGEEIAARYFSRHEVAELKALPPDLRAAGFYLCWTRKEAYVKARGAGLSIPLKSFHVSLTPGHPEQLHSADSSRWSIHSLQSDAKYAGALVVEGKDWRLRCWDWEPAACD